ncbi:hypothetical protein R1sor_010265 [Riccia sorocarpa]|uniref:Uncharacterized protein n=1 Tax=Riccia sorocarpa TaxID=122646 RepID=A0ABD3HZG0_9MARC
MMHLNIDMLERTSNSRDNLDTFECFVLVTDGMFYYPSIEVSKRFLNVDVIDKMGELTLTITCQGEECQTFCQSFAEAQLREVDNVSQKKQYKIHRGDCDFVLRMNRNTDITVVQAIHATSMYAMDGWMRLASIGGKAYKGKEEVIDIEFDEPLGNKLVKPCAVREPIHGMRIRGCTPINESTSGGNEGNKKQKFNHQSDIHHEPTQPDNLLESAE